MMEWLITLGVGLAVIVVGIATVLLALCIRSFFSIRDGSPWWMKTVGGVTTLTVMALIIGAMVRFG